MCQIVPGNRQALRENNQISAWPAMSAEQMDLAEFTARMWTEYPRDLCHNKPGHKARVEKAAQKIDKSLYKQILLDMDALKRYDRKQHQPDRWPLISSFLNGRYWERLIDSVMETKKAEKKEPEKCKCGHPVEIGPTGECAECYAKRTDPNLQRRKNALESINLYSPGQSRSEVIENCRAALLPQINSGSCYKVKPIPFLQNSSKPSEPESLESNTKVIYGEEWFKENAERIYGGTGVKFDV